MEKIKKKEAILFRLNKNAKDLLMKIAEQEERTMASVVRQAIKEYLEKRKHEGN